MKVLQLASGDLWAGAEVQLYYLSCELARQGIDILVVLLNEGQLSQRLKSKNINVVIFNENKLSTLDILIGLFRLARKFRPDIIHTHRSKENIIGSLISLFFNSACIRTVHGKNEFTNHKFSLKRYIRENLDRYTGKFIQQLIISVSDELKHELCKKFPKHKVTVIENGIDIESVKFNSEATIDFRKTEGQFNIAFVGRFVPVKRVDLFYDIAKVIIQNDSAKNIHFYMFGDGPLKQHIENRIAADSYSERIHLAGFVPDVAPYLRHMDLLLITSEHEGLPMSLLEAISLKVPVMSCDLPTIKQVLCDGDCGIFANSGSIVEFSNLILNASNEPRKLERNKNNAWNKLLAGYTANIQAEKYIKQYNKLSHSNLR